MLLGRKATNLQANNPSLFFFFFFWRGGGGGGEGGGAILQISSWNGNDMRTCGVEVGVTFDKPVTCTVTGSNHQVSLCWERGLWHSPAVWVLSLSLQIVYLLQFGYSVCQCRLSISCSLGTPLVNADCRSPAVWVLHLSVQIVDLLQFGYSACQCRLSISCSLGTPLVSADSRSPAVWVLCLSVQRTDKSSFVP